MMRIAVVGTGYVGLVSGACLAAKGHTVTCVDSDVGKVERIRRGEPPIHEAGLKELLDENLGTRLFATGDLAAAVADADLTLIAVGTPFDGSAIDVRYIRQAAEQIGAALKGRPDYHTVVVKSTVVPGTTDGIVRPALEAASGKVAGDGFGLGMNPEFLREGSAVEDFMQPDRIVLGAMDATTAAALRKMYAPFENVDLVSTTNRTAEMIKYASNALLATLISFSNEIANLCSTVGGIDASEVMRGVHLDRRLSPILPDGQRITPVATTYLEAGCGFGGSCFPKDLKALIAYGRENGSRMRLLQSVIDINHDQPKRMLGHLARHFRSLDGVRVAVLGLAFKPDTDDVRESPAIPIVASLVKKGAVVTVYDPVATTEARKALDALPIKYADDLESAVADAEAVMLVTRWDEFKRIPELVHARKNQPLVVDGRRMLGKNCVDRYEGIGL